MGVRVDGAVALVTGANGGVGNAFCRALVDRGARSVYAGARNPGAVTEAGVTPFALDLTDAEQIARAAHDHPDVTLLVNNAAAMMPVPLIGADSLDNARHEMEVNYFGTLALCRAFAPVLARNGGGAIVNMLSVTSWYTPAAYGSCAVSKAAAWSMTNGIRAELAAQGTLVVAVHASVIVADATEGKVSRAEVAQLSLDAVEQDAPEVLADARSRAVKASLADEPLQ
jgi:NAD(P)-dependent dehydrogenase (short-subunit alcohol dehydrogenase family)